MKHVLIDVDGVLADYRLGLLWWVNTHYPELREVCYKHLGRLDTWIDAGTMGVPYREWLGILENFRMSGGKVTVPTFPGAKELIAYLNLELGYKVILITSRPIDIYSNIYRDTLEWLKQNHIEHHMLLWSKDKSDLTYKLRLVDDCAFAIDDEIGHAKKYAQLGIKTYWLNHYNVKQPKIENLIEVRTLEQIFQAEEKESAQ